MYRRPAPPPGVPVPPGVQAGPSANGPVGSAFAQNGVGMAQVALATDSNIGSSSGQSSPLNIRMPCELQSVEYPLHTCVSFSFDELNSMPMSQWPTKLDVHLGSMVKALMRDQKISANAQVRGIQINVVNGSPVPVACDVFLYRMGLDYDNMTFVPVDDAVHSHYYPDGGPSTVICPSQKTVSCPALPLRDVEDNFVSRSGFFQMTLARKAKVVEKSANEVITYHVRNNTFLPAYIQDAILWYLIDNKRLNAVPITSDHKFWNEYTQRVSGVLSPVTQESAFAIKSDNLCDYSNQLLRLRSMTILANDLLAVTERQVAGKPPYTPKVSGVNFGLTVRIFPVNLAKPAAANVQESATSNVFNESNDWIIAAAGSKEQASLRAVLKATYMVSCIVTITFAVPPPDVLKSDLAKFPPVELFK